MVAAIFTKYGRYYLHVFKIKVLFLVASLLHYSSRSTSQLRLT